MLLSFSTSSVLRHVCCKSHPKWSNDCMILKLDWSRDITVSRLVICFGSMVWFWNEFLKCHYCALILFAEWFWCRQTWFPSKKASPRFFFIRYHQMFRSYLNGTCRVGTLAPRHHKKPGLTLHPKMQSGCRGLITNCFALWTSCSCVKLLVHLDILSDYCIVELLLIPVLSVRALTSGFKNCFLHPLAESTNCLILNKSEHFWLRTSLFWQPKVR